MFPQEVYSVNTPQGRQQPRDILKKSGDLRERSAQLLRHLKRLLHESEQLRYTVNTRIDELMSKGTQTSLSSQ